LPNGGSHVGTTLGRDPAEEGLHLAGSLVTGLEQTARQLATDRVADQDREAISTIELSGVAVPAVVAVEVTVPATLTVSEDNAYAPNADIVWREDPFGNRHEQVDAIITNAAKRGASGLQGTRAVKLLITVQQFHALSEKARALLNNSGVHNIILTAQVVDAKTNNPLSPPDSIEADLVAFVGDQAIAAEKQGLTQKVRITNHVAKVIAGWLGSGEDVRGTFTRNGR